MISTIHIQTLSSTRRKKEILDVYEDSTLLITTLPTWLWGFDGPSCSHASEISLPGCTILIATIPMAPSGAVQQKFSLSES